MILNSESYFQQSENFVEKKDSLLWKNKANITLSLKTAFISFSAKELTHPLCPRITKLCPNIIVILMQVSVNFRLQMTKTNCQFLLMMLQPKTLR